MSSFTAILFATIVRVVDGDTLIVNLPCDIDILCSDVSVRIEHIDTPEIRGKCPEEKALALQAKEAVKKLLPVGSTITIASPKRDKYFRILADVPKVSAALVDASLARKYEGDKKFGWCGGTAQINNISR